MRKKEREKYPWRKEPLDWMVIHRKRVLSPSKAHVE